MQSSCGGSSQSSGEDGVVNTAIQFHVVCTRGVPDQELVEDSRPAFRRDMMSEPER